MTDDIRMLQYEEAAIFEFNQELLRRTKTHSDEELQKKLRLTMASKIAHQRVERGLKLLLEYLDSIEFMSDAEISATKQMIKDTVEEVLKRQRDR